MFIIARANYAGVFGTNAIEDSPKSGNGTFYENSKIRFGYLYDGLTHTMIVGERSSRYPGTTWVGAVPQAHQSKARVVGRAERVANNILGHFADFSSDHPAGAFFLMAGGSVHLFTDEMDVEVYRALATRAADRTGDLISHVPPQAGDDEPWVFLDHRPTQSADPRTSGYTAQ